MPTEIKQADEGDKEPAAEGEAAAPESMEQKMKVYQKMLERLSADNKDSDDEIKELEIKTKINDFCATNSTTRLSNELLSEAFRWRLSQNDC